MKKLVVSGCSWGDPYFISMQHPSMDTTWLKWPEILAEKMNMEPVNLCKSGMGNEYIYSSLSDYLSKININEVGHVIAAWSSAPRRDWEKTTSWTGTRNDKAFANNKYRDIIKNVTNWNNIRTDTKGDIKYWINKTIRYQYAFQNLMEQQKTRVSDQALFYNQVQMISLIRGHIWEITNGVDYSALNENDMQAKLDKFQQFAELQKHGMEYVRDTMLITYLKTLKSSRYEFKDNFLGWPTDEKLEGYTIESLLKEEHRVSVSDRHPNALGQVRIAEILYEKINSKWL